MAAIWGRSQAVLVTAVVLRAARPERLAERPIAADFKLEVEAEEAPGLPCVRLRILRTTARVIADSTSMAPTPTPATSTKFHFLPGMGLLVLTPVQAPQFGPPQSTPSSLPFRAPSAQEVRAPARKIQAPRDRRYPGMQEPQAAPVYPG